jgi:hypothetical protein
MPPPDSIIPSSEPTELAVAIARTEAIRAGTPLRAFRPSVPETEFKKRFPLPYQVQAISIYEAQGHGWPTDRSYWRFLQPFQYVSLKWGAIDIPKDFVTDFASVPPKLHSVIDDDSPIILLPSAPHDFLFTKRSDKNGTRGWVSDTKQLTLTEVNHILTEAMSLCGADMLTRNVVFAAVELANQGIKNEFA